MLNVCKFEKQNVPRFSKDYQETKKFSVISLIVCENGHFSASGQVSANLNIKQFKDFQRIM